ncbi:BRCT domain-containing protein [Polyangium sp. 6x1]|uniref:BRCT domain-containing protein n=1 Tax=Polyangium sp. 6x1 TaxID=3042689 RepID=UPI002482EC05|nr:BRCT domain-containing protein [Polyangium sp. 6x1]MDI1445587.1 PQQ-binding-like beta-propeller repeat protein [Polyangium sp. 6x1]
MALDVRGKTVVLTGTFSKLKRAEAEKQLAALGAKIGSSVGKSTHILFAGEKAGSKIDAAGRLGITVLGEDELMALLAGPSKKGAASKQAPSKQVASAFAALDPKAPGAALAAAIEALPWDDFDADRDLPALREVLCAHEAAHGITAAHQAATARLRPRATLQHAHGHDVEVSWSELSPDGRFLATGSWTGDDYDLGGVLQIWDVRAARCVNMMRVRGGVGWPDHGDCIQWRPDGKRVGLAFDTNGVGSFDPFGKSGEPESCAYVTDGWNRPPSWGWSANNRDVYVACWGPNLALGAIVPLIGRRPAPRWCQSAGRSDPNDPSSEPRLRPLGNIDGSHPDRFVGESEGQVVALDAKTGKVLWEQKAHAPVAFSPDGSEFAMHPAGLVYYDAATGLPNGKVPMHVGAESLLYSRDGSRLAAIVQPENRWGAEPGIFIYDRGTYRYSLDVPAPRTDETYGFAWRPDGRAAVITVRGRLQVWELGDAPTRVLDIAGPKGGVAYGDGVLVSFTSKGLLFLRDHDGAEIGRFRPAVESSGDNPLAQGEDDYGCDFTFPPAFPLDRERVAAALPEGVVIGPVDASASVAEIDGKIAWVLDRKWAWPWRWGEAKVWPDVAAAAADPAAPAAFKRKFGKKGKPPARTKKVNWPPPGGSIEDVAALVGESVKAIDNGHIRDDYQQRFAERVMVLGFFDRAAAVLDGTDGWPRWHHPWHSACARAETVVGALAWRKSEAPLTGAQTKTLRRWLGEAEKLLTKKEAKERSASPPRAMIGAGWVLLGESARGDELLASAIATVDPEVNAGENRRVVAEALTAVGRIREAIDMIASGEEKPSWTETRPVFSVICPRASAAELKYLVSRMKEREAHNEFELLERGLSRLIALKEWDAAVAWLSEFDGLSTRVSRIELAAAMAAAGEPARAEAAMAKELVPKYESSAEYLLGLARVAPERANKHLEAILKKAPKLRDESRDFPRHLAAAAATLGRLDIAAKLEKSAPNVLDAFEVRAGVLGALDPSHPEWKAWFTRARELEPDHRKLAQRMATLAFRGGLADESVAFLDQAIEMARGEGYPDIALQDVSAVMVAAGDLAGAHRAFMSISKGMRSHRNGPILSATMERGLWAATVDLLRQMPEDINGRARHGLSILLKLTDRDGF